MSKYEDPTQLDYRYGGDTVDDFAQKYMKTVAYIFSALNELRSPTGGTLTQNPEAYQFKVDDNKLYIRNQANTDWILLGDVQENFGFRTSASDAFMHESDVADSGTAGKLIRADASGKLNADILGNAAKIADKAIQMGLDLADEDRLVYDKDTDTITNRPLQFRVDGDKIYARKDATTGWVLLGDLKQNLGFRSSTDDAFLTESDVADSGTAGKLIRADVNGKLNADILGNARKMAGKTFAPEDLQDGQIPVYRVSDGTWHAENKGTVGTGKNLMIMDGDKMLGEYNGDEMKAIDIQKSSLTKALAESTGYGIVSGCEPSISGLTVKVGAGVIHLADGTRKEIVQTNITLDAADPTNPRIDLVYIDSTGTVAKITGTAAASPVVPALPSGDISVCNVTIAAGATTGTLTDSRNYLFKNKLVYSNVNHFITDERLTVGDTITTLGYYSEFDNGGANYIIRQKETSDVVSSNVDGSTSDDLLILLKNGLVAELQCNGLLNARQIGCGNEGTTINNNALITAIKKGNSIFFPAGNYYFSSTLYLNYDFTIKCDANAVFYPAANMNWMVYIGDAPLTIPGRDGSHSKALSNFITYSWEGGTIDCHNGGYAAQSGLCSAKSYHSVVRDLAVVHPTDKGIGITGASYGAYSLFDNIVVRCENNATHVNYGFYIDEYDQTFMRCSVINCKVGFYTTKQNISFYQCTAWMAETNGWDDTVCFQIGSNSTIIRYYNCMVDTMHIGFKLDNNTTFRGIGYGIMWMNNSSVNNQDKTHKYCTLVTAPSGTSKSDTAIVFPIYGLQTTVNTTVNTLRENVTAQQCPSCDSFRYMSANRDRFDETEDVVNLATHQMGNSFFTVRAGAQNAPTADTQYMYQAYCWDAAYKWAHITAAGLDGSFYVGRIQDGVVKWTAK